LRRVGERGSEGDGRAHAGEDRRRGGDRTDRRRELCSPPDEVCKEQVVREIGVEQALDLDPSGQRWRRSRTAVSIAASV